MLTRKEYETIEKEMRRYTDDGVWLVAAMRFGARACADHVLNLLKENYVQEEEQTECGIDCDALNKALKEGTIRFIYSMEGGAAFVPGEQKTVHVFKEGGRHAGRFFENRECYVKSDETEKELWDRLNGHQRCMKSAADVAYKEQKKAEENGATGIIRDILNRLYKLEQGFGTIACVILEHGDVGMFNELQNNITKLRKITAEDFQKAMNRGNNMMSLDEAILHFKERAAKDCSECARWHLQIAKWLDELKLLRKNNKFQKAMNGETK